ncbi:MAG TPA: hypothetical protein VM328_10755 [Fimbriimonadaceae bacterium]|nr:hypothetical protein [Fimbriimonadaceae bacterium]
MTGFDPEDATTQELFQAYRAILSELKRRKIVRTANAPAGDYAEYLVARTLRGELAPNSERSYDLITEDGRRIQVKCRVAGDSGRNPRSQLSPFRTFGFDAAVVVLSAPDYRVHQAVVIPRETVEASARFVKHVNGYVVHARPSFLNAPGNVDITDAVRRAASDP